MIINTLSKQFIPDEVINLYKNSSLFRRMGLYLLTGFGAVTELDCVNDLHAAILSHKCESPNIIVDDDVETLRMGYTCEGCRSYWVVRLDNVKKFGPIELVCSHEAREKFANGLSNALKINVPSEVTIGP